MNNHSEIPANIAKEVQLLLEKSEQKLGAQPIMVVETGLYARGYPSYNSASEIRFIYTQPLEWYLRLKESKDLISNDLSEETQGFSFEGWELRRFLRGLQKSQIFLWEWVQSPVVLIDQNNVLFELKELALQFFSAQAAFRHYNSLAAKGLEASQGDTSIPLTLYLNMLRATIACRWTFSKKGVPPIGILDLLEQELPAPIKNMIIELVATKKLESEEALTQPKQELNKFVEQTLLEGIEIADALGTSKGEVKELDQMLAKLVFQHARSLSRTTSCSDD